MDVKTRIFQWLDRGRAVSARWEAGFDDTVVSIFVDEHQLPWEDPVCDVLIDAIVETLQLPNAGEWFLDGGGALRRDGQELVIDHASTGRGRHWDPDTETEHWTDGKEVVGSEVLFR